MATLNGNDVSVTINSVDLSDHVESVNLDRGAEANDDTAMGDTTRSSKGGLKTWSGSLTFYQDYASSSVDDTLDALVGSTTTVVFKPTSGSVSSTNPSFTGTALITGYTGIQGSVGDIAKASLEFTSAGDLTRATS